MKGHNRLWMVLVVSSILIAGHGVILYYLSSHLAVSTAIVAGVIVLVAAKHLGLLGPLYALLRKSRRQS